MLRLIQIKNLCILILALFSMPIHADFVQDLIAKFPGTADAKISPAFPGFFSIVKGGEVLFIRDDLSVLINGDVLDLAANQSLTHTLREANKPRINVNELDPADAIQFGTGSRKLYVFSDPDCPYCRDLEVELDKLKNTQIFLFPFPLTSLHPKARVIAESVWCANDRATAWKNYIHRAQQPKFVTCDNPISRNLALGEKYQIQGTPALIFEDGTVIPGAIPAERIEQQLAVSSQS